MRVLWATSSSVGWLLIAWTLLSSVLWPGCCHKFIMLLSTSSSSLVRGCIDLSFSERMALVEHRSLQAQLIRVFGMSRKHASPLSLSLASVAAARAAAPFCLPADHHLRAWADSGLGRAGLFEIHERSAADTWPAEQLVWLSPDAEEPLTTLEPGIVYVMGGLIDRSVLKGATLACARQAGARARRLPLREYAPRADVHPIQSLPACWSMLCDVHGGASWKEAIANALPARFLTRREREEEQRREQLAAAVGGQTSLQRAGGEGNLHTCP